MISKENIKIPSKMVFQNSEIGISELFDSGELRFGKVIGVNRTNRGRIVLMELIDASICVLDEESVSGDVSFPSFCFHPFWS